MLGYVLVSPSGGFLAGANTNRGEHGICFGNVFLVDLGASRSLALWNLGASVLSDSSIISDFRGAKIVLAIFWRRGS